MLYSKKKDGAFLRYRQWFALCYFKAMAHLRELILVCPFSTPIATLLLIYSMLSPVFLPIPVHYTSVKKTGCRLTDTSPIVLRLAVRKMEIVSAVLELSFESTHALVQWYNEGQWPRCWLVWWWLERSTLQHRDVDPLHPFHVLP